jgi:hypothetical protein
MYPILTKHEFALSESNFNVLITAEKRINNKYNNVKAAFNCKFRSY